MREEIQTFNEIQMFNPNPEANEPYYTIYRGDKLFGRSNSCVALMRFLLNVKLANKNNNPSDDSEFKIAFDNQMTILNIKQNGRINGQVNDLYTFYLNKLFKNEY